MKNRLLRLLRDNRDATETQLLLDLAEKTAAKASTNKQLRQIVDALHSAILSYLPPPARHIILERWIDRGTRGSMARWLKATKEDLASFDANIALAYWRASRDYRAAKSLAYQSDPQTLRPMIPELVRHCEHGWIVARAIIRVGDADNECWSHIRAEHPATYLYLHAQLRKPIKPDDAFELICRCQASGLEGDRGLAIWSVGQLAMVDVLDRIARSLDQMQSADMELPFRQ